VYLQGCFRDEIAQGERMAFVAEISNQKSSGFQVESLSKLATIFASSCVLSCRTREGYALGIGALGTQPDGPGRTEGSEQTPHANISTTMNVYGGAFMESKRKANTSVVQRVLVQDRTKWQKAVTWTASAVVLQTL